VDGDDAGDQILRGVSADEREGRSTGTSGLERPIRADVRSTESQIAVTESDELWRRSRTGCSRAARMPFAAV
jgi:hypothetical protein